MEKNNLETIKKEYYSLLEKIINRKGVKELNNYLETHGLFSSPASTKYHLCVEGGLVIHSINVAKLALELKKSLLPLVSDESVILCALFHDCHKVTDGFSNPTYIKNELNGIEKQPYLWNKNQFSFSGAHKSLLIISKFVELTQDEMQAIAYHDGPYVESWQDIASDPYPLTFLIHFADLWSTWVIEKGRDKISFNKKFLQDN